MTTTSGRPLPRLLHCGHRITDADGLATLAHIRQNLGTDLITAYTDTNNSGTRQSHEPQAQVNVTFFDPALVITRLDTVWGINAAEPPFFVRLAVANTGQTMLPDLVVALHWAPGCQRRLVFGAKPVTEPQQPSQHGLYR